MSNNILTAPTQFKYWFLETAKNKFVAHGVELNPWLVLYSKINAFRHGLGSQTKFVRKDLWKYDVSKYDNIVIFGVEQMVRVKRTFYVYVTVSLIILQMADLEKKFVKECKSDCNILACRFPLPNLRPLRTIGYGIDTVWVYRIENSWQLQKTYFSPYQLFLSYSPFLYFVFLMYNLNMF